MFKKIFGCFLILATCFTLASCSKNKYIKLSYVEKQIEVFVGDEVNVKPNVEIGKKVKGYELEYTLSSNIATVNDGVLVANEAGTVILTVTANNKEKSYAELTIIIKEAVKPSIKDDFNCITVAEAIAKAQQAGTNGTTEKFYVYGKIVSVDNSMYGAMTIADETGSIYVYGVVSKDGNTRYDALAEKPIVGDEVVLYGILKTYNGTPEMDRGFLQAMNHIEVEVDVKDYKEYTVAAARTLEINEKVKLTGVVAKITYAFGQVANGFYLVDNTGSIYIYGKDTAGNVSEGNTVTIIGEKTYYILEDEINAANKHGYKGCCQIQNVTLVENDKKVSEFDKSWIEESTVKEIVENDITNDITTNIYKVKALINKVPGTGFINYYINDLDGVTGSYVYTACNGSDFAWLDQYDGKICTVYLSPINAKSTNAGCIYRFIPVKVELEEYTFDQNLGAQFVLDYYAKDQFLSHYQSDPELEVVTNVSNNIINIQNATISYTSDNEDIAYFELIEGKTIFHTTGEGAVNVTIKATYNSVVATTTVQINVTKPIVYDTISVLDAINSADETEVYLRGIVMSSLVNQSGFYLNDGTGIIAVVGDAADIALLSAGDEVVIKGIKSHRVKEGYTGKGQINVYNAEILVNYYGNNTYDDSFFDSTKTLNELKNYSDLEDHSTEVYVVQAIINVVEAQYYTSITIKSPDGAVSMNLYSSSASQYNFLKQFNGQEVTLELALCNWNGKNFYAGCVIAVRNSDGSKIINTLNFAE